MQSGTQTVGDSGKDPRLYGLPNSRVARQKWRVKLDRRTSIPGYHGQFLPGEYEVIIYEDQVKHLMAKVEDQPELVRQAHDLYERRKKEAMQKAEAVIEERKNSPGGISAEEEGHIRRQALSHFRDRPETVYYELTRGSVDAYGNPRLGMRPISEAEKLEDLPAPQDEQTQLIGQVAASLGTGVQQAQTGNGATDQQALLDMLEKQQARIDALEKELQQRRSGKASKSD